MRPGEWARRRAAAVDADARLALVARLGRGDELGDLGGADVAVEFSVPDASPANVARCVDAWRPRRGRHHRLDDDRVQALRGQVAGMPGVGVLIAPNFAIGAILMMSFAQQAARFYESVEVVELHHPDKVDAPSGTAARTASLIGARGGTPASATCPTRPPPTPVAPAGRAWTAYRCTPLRLRGLVAHQEVLFGATGELLTIRHDSFDRESFMPGVLEGVRQVAAHPGVTVGLEHYLGLA